LPEISTSARAGSLGTINAELINDVDFPRVRIAARARALIK
jgi:hypothetical protein